MPTHSNGHPGPVREPAEPLYPPGGCGFVAGVDIMTRTVTVPFATTRTKTHFGVRPTLEEWKEAFDRNIAPYVSTNDRSTGIEPKSPADRLARNRRIAVQIREKRERVRACEMEVADTIRRLVSAEGGTEWEYDVRAGKVTVT